MYVEESLAFCAGQCQASRFPPATCRCICGGRNHGILHYRPGPVNVTPYHYPEYRVIDGQPVPYALPTPRLLPSPDAIDVTGRSIWKDQPRKGDTVEYRKGKARLKTAKSFLKAVTGYRSPDDLNNRILSGLHNQFNSERIDAIVDQAFSVFYSRMGPDSNRPELYELYENGDIDRALSIFNVRWVIGRPKLK